jgi:hypothetical protein
MALTRSFADARAQDWIVATSGEGFGEGDDALVACRRHLRVDGCRAPRSPAARPARRGAGRRVRRERGTAPSRTSPSRPPQAWKRRDLGTRHPHVTGVIRSPSTTCSSWTSELTAPVVTQRSRRGVDGLQRVRGDRRSVIVGGDVGEHGLAGEQVEIEERTAVV